MILTVSGGYLLLAELPPAILDAGPLAARVATWVGARQPAVVAVAVSLLGLPAVALTVRATRAQGRPAPIESDRRLPDAAASDVTDAASGMRR